MSTPAEHPLAGQVVLVTGASTGIGRHLAEGLAARGASVAGLARGAERLTAAMVEAAAATGARTLAAPADVTDRAAVEAAVARVLDEFGHIDLLVNNAGLMDVQEVRPWEADPDDWWRVVTSHIRGAHLLAHAVIPGMLARGTGRIVSLASGLGTRASPVYSAYSVGKTGLMRLTEALALALEGTGVHAFDLSPGVVRTEMTAAMSLHVGRTDWTDPKDVIDTVAHIASGDFDTWSGRYLRAGTDDLTTMRSMEPEGPVRQLRLVPHGDDDTAG